MEVRNEIRCLHDEFKIWTQILLSQHRLQASLGSRGSLREGNSLQKHPTFHLAHGSRSASRSMRPPKPKFQGSFTGFHVGSGSVEASGILQQAIPWRRFGAD